MIRIDLGKEDLQGTRRQGKTKGKSNDFLKGLKLPPQLEKKLRKYTSDLGMLIATGVALGIAALFPLVVGQLKTQKIAAHDEVVKALKVKVDALNGEIAKSGPIKTELDSYEQQKKIVSDRLGIVRELLDQRATPINVLDTVGQSLPPRTWVGNIDFVVQGDAPNLVMTGTAYSNEEISDFVDKLSESIYLSDISLDDVGNRTEEKVDFKTFSITAKPKTKLLGSSAPVVDPAATAKK